MNFNCITLFEVLGDSSTIQKLEDEYFTHQTWETWSDSTDLWGLDFNKIVPTPHSLMLELDLIISLEFKHRIAHEMVNMLFYPKRKTRPTVKKAMADLSTMPNLLPSEFARPKNLYQVMVLLRQTEIGRKLIFLNHLHFRNRKRYGKDALINWRTKHWGSSVPCKHFEVLGKGRYLLHTSYNPPLIVLQRLSELLGQVTIRVRYMDTQLLSAGTREWHDGVLVNEVKIAPHEFALELFFDTEISKLTC